MNQVTATNAPALTATTQSPGLFGLLVSNLEMQGQNLDTGWFNNAGGGSSILQISQGTVPDGGVPDFFNPAPLAQVAPYVGGNIACVGVGFNATGVCGDFMSTTTPTQVNMGCSWKPRVGMS